LQWLYTPVLDCSLRIIKIRWDFTVAAHSIGQYLLLGTATVDVLASHHCVAWISNHASEHSHRNSAVQLGDEERTKLLLTEMCRYK